MRVSSGGSLSRGATWITRARKALLHHAVAISSAPAGPQFQLRHPEDGSEAPIQAPLFEEDDAASQGPEGPSRCGPVRSLARCSSCDMAAPLERGGALSTRAQGHSTGSACRARGSWGRASSPRKAPQHCRTTRRAPALRLCSPAFHCRGVVAPTPSHCLDGCVPFGRRRCWSPRPPARERSGREPSRSGRPRR